MLMLCRKSRPETARLLTAEDDRALRQAFGRFADPTMRAEGAAVVRRYQHEGSGHWFLCDCLGDRVRRPVLVPVLESFIRRHTEPPWPQHAEECDFARDPGEQRVVTESFARPASRLAGLIRRFTDEHVDPETRASEFRGYSRRRERLAALLMQLITDAGLTILKARMAVPGLGDQFRAIRGAARQIDIDRGRKLAPFLCTYSPALPEFVARIAEATADQFPTTRPHGIFIGVIAGVAGGNLVIDADTRLPVHGRIAVFAERDGHSRDDQALQADRAPYLAICLVGRPGRQEPVQILRAYVHPCVGKRHLMLVDSNLERKTLRQIRSLQRWLSDRLDIEIDIEKPCFDIAPGVTNGVEEGVGAPCIPDFIVKRSSIHPCSSKTVIVETMGYDDALYRVRKQSVHSRMSAALANAPVVEHDFHRPPESNQEDRNRAFWQRLRRTLTGPGMAGSRRVAACVESEQPPLSR